MATNKNQHYVPLCHLRPFTANGAGRSINVFNMDTARSIPNAPVKRQCSGKYFYGQDARLEAAIGGVESAYGEAVRRLTARDGPIDEWLRVSLRRFVYLQHVRTEAASRKAAEMVFAMHEGAVEPSELPTMRQAMLDGVQGAMYTFASTMRIVDDLKIVILRNQTAVPFVTSDDPAVLTNRLHLQSASRRFEAFGSRSAGAIFVLPLSPDLCCLFYDGDVYTVASNAGRLLISSIADVHALNEHQYAGCRANVYFRDWALRDEVRAAAARAEELRPTQSHTIVHAVRDSEGDWGARYVVRPVEELQDGDDVLMHVTANHPRVRRWPSFLRYRGDRRAHSNDTGAGLTRRGCIDAGFVEGRGWRKIHP